MCHESFSSRENLNVLRQSRKSIFADVLHANAFHEVRSAEAAACPRPSGGRQNVIASAGIITKWLRAPRTKKNSSSGLNLLQQGFGILRQAQMFGREAVHKLTRLLHRGRQ